MKTAITLLAAALTLTASATSLGEKSHDVSSANGKFKLHVDVDTHIHKITGEFPAGDEGWQFEHDAQFHSVFLSDNGRVAAVVHWSWCQEEDLDKPAVVIYDRMAEKFGAAGVKDGKEILATGFRPGIKKSYTYRQLSKPRVRKPDEIGPIGDFWRVWWDDAAVKDDVLTINVEGGKPVIIDLANPPEIPLPQAANEADQE